MPKKMKYQLKPKNRYTHPIESRIRFLKGRIRYEKYAAEDAWFVKTKKIDMPIQSNPEFVF